MGNVAPISAPMSTDTNPVMPTSTIVALPPPPPTHTRIDPLPTAPGPLPHGQTNINNETNGPRLPSLF